MQTFTQLCEEVCVMEDGQLLEVMDNKVVSVERNTNSYLENVRQSLEE